jgi:hypothetical protein
MGCDRRQVTGAKAWLVSPDNLAHPIADAAEFPAATRMQPKYRYMSI